MDLPMYRCGGFVADRICIEELGARLDKCYNDHARKG